ncbi:hypothetical protein QR680_002402 [Steinernema hermaphroditum]|uniref:DJ-1/PfpI domain-containing protein n=1 Tax=Steinernema hermaphroditum TaxID=289476 RepID=A0AA39H4Q7_9BILA|nr:hypothetical protein QR680_002402 [Steinernema hermaphroditum]
MSSALVVASNGSEDMELVISVDVLRRANVKVTVAGLQDADRITCARGTTIIVDEKLEDVASKIYDVVVLPGGQPGSNNFAASSVVGDVLRAHEKAGSLIAAICAAPIALKSHGIAMDATLTSYPGVSDEIQKAGYKYSEDRVGMLLDCCTRGFLRFPVPVCKRRGDFGIASSATRQSRHRSQTVHAPSLSPLVTSVHSALNRYP